MGCCIERQPVLFIGKVFKSDNITRLIIASYDTGIGKKMADIIKKCYRRYLEKALVVIYSFKVDKYYDETGSQLYKMDYIWENPDNPLQLIDYIRENSDDSLLLSE